MRHGTHRHAANRAELLVEPFIELDVGEALDAFATLPRPLRDPLHGLAMDRFERRALRTRGRTRRAPKVG